MAYPDLYAGASHRDGGRHQVDPVEWIAPPDPADRALLRRWSAAVGPPVREARVCPPGTVENLVVVSWNVRVGGGDVVGFVDDLRRGRLTGAAVSHFVLLLQEAYRASHSLPPLAAGSRVPRRIAPAPPGGERIDIVTAASELGLDLVYVPSMRNGRGRRTTPEDRGNAILSSVPLARPHAIELPFEAQRRVSVCVRVELPWCDVSPTRLEAVSVHLDNRSRPRRLCAAAGTGRLRQATRLLEALHSHAPTVLGGDLNTWAGDRLERALPLLRSRFPDTPSGPAPATYAVGTPFARRLDHLFYRLPAGYRASLERVASRYGSDHHPLIGLIRPR